MGKYTVAIVDQHSLFRLGVKALIAKFDDIEFSWEAWNGNDMQDKFSSEGVPDLVIMDIPEITGAEASAWIKKNHPGVKILILSMHREREKILPLLKTGINGYVLKSTPDVNLLIDAIRLIRGGDVFFPTFVTKFLLDEYQDDASRLNKREIEFLQLAATELTYKEIADKMQITARTVEGYREQLFTKLKVTSRVGLVLFAVKHRLITI